MAGRIRRVAAVVLLAAVSSAVLAGCRLDHRVAPPGLEPLPPGDGFIAGRFTARPGPLFAVPDDDPDANLAVHSLLENIRHTPRGATIRIVAYSFSIMRVSDALIAAERRGVHVQVVVDGRHSHEFQATQALESALGGDRHRTSFVVLTDRSARGTVSHSHQKSWSFSQTGDSHHVVMVGSTNLSVYGTTDQYSDMYSFVGRGDVWRAFSAVFRAQARDVPVADPAVTDRLGGDTAYFFPGFSMADDPIARTIAALPADPSTHIRIVMYAWHPPRGQRIVNLLRRLLDGGASVEIVRGPFARQPLGALGAAGAKIRRGVFAGGENVHDKLMIVRDVRGGRPERFVVTGSDNWGNVSFLRDDVDMRIALDAREYHAYVAFVRRLARRAVAERRSQR